MADILTGAKYMLMVEDMTRASRFYCKGLGFTAAFESPHWSELKLKGGATVALHGGGTKAPRDTGLSFDTADIKAACAAIVEAGGVITMEPQARPNEPILLAKARDTEGNAFSISQYKG
jgi:predicted enzyme related to lactoylglutathione lyase